MGSNPTRSAISAMLVPTPEENARRSSVMAAVIEATRRGATIRLPAFDHRVSEPSDSALITVGIEPNPFGGTVGPFRYQFEGEEDLLHLFVTRQNGGPLSVEEGREVARFLMPDLPETLVWLKPGERSQHFYLAHDELLR